MNNNLTSKNSQGDMLQEFKLGSVQEQGIARSVMEVRASIEVARAFPRVMQDCQRQLIDACSIPSFAKTAFYSRLVAHDKETGKPINAIGPSIRLAEEIVVIMGNIDYGTRVISQEKTETVYEVFAFDKEKNLRVSRIFSSSHIRHTKTNNYLETRPQKQYEMVASDAAKRLRACLLSIVPNYMICIAEDACKKTLGGDKSFVLSDLLGAYSIIGVTEKMLMDRFGGIDLKSLTEDSIAMLRLDYQSIKNGECSVSDIFGEIKKNG